MRLLVFINTFAGNKANHDCIKSFLAEKLMVDHLETFENDLSKIPEELLEAAHKEGFATGMAFEQWRRIQKDGTFVNPLIVGMADDFDFWSSFILDGSFEQTAVYVDVPYELYQEAAGNEAVDEEYYKAGSEASMIIANCLRGKNGKTLH